eukprot:271233-Prymnesium_polylepis.1
MGKSPCSTCAAHACTSSTSPARERHDELVWRVLGRGHWPVCAWSRGWHPARVAVRCQSCVA